MCHQRHLSVILALCVAALVIETCQAQPVCGPGTAPDLYGNCVGCTQTPNCADCGTTYYGDPCTACLYPKYGFTSPGQCGDCGAGCYACNASVSACDTCETSTNGPVIGTNPQTCAPCSSNCAGCQNKGSGKCDVCQPQFAFDLATRTTCGACSPSTCVSCEKTGPGYCDDCSPTFGVDNTPGATPPRCKLCESANCENCFGNFQMCDLCKSGLTADTTTGQCKPNAPQYIFRQDWNALHYTSFKLTSWRTTTIKSVIVHHTHNKMPTTYEICKFIVIAMQDNVMNKYMDKSKKKLMAYSDVNYSFFICPVDGSIFVARGINYATNLRPYGVGISQEIAIIGNHLKVSPTALAMKAFSDHVEISKPYTLDPNVKTYTDYDVRCTSCPGMIRKMIEARSDFGGIIATCPPHSRGARRSSRK